MDYCIKFNRIAFIPRERAFEKHLEKMIEGFLFYHSENDRFVWFNKKDWQEFVVFGKRTCVTCELAVRDIQQNDKRTH